MPAVTSVSIRITEEDWAMIALHQQRLGDNPAQLYQLPAGGRGDREGRQRIATPETASRPQRFCPPLNTAWRAP